MRQLEDFLNESGNNGFYRVVKNKYKWIFNFYVNNESVHSLVVDTDDMLDGDVDWKYKGKSYSNFNQMKAAVAKENGVKDFTEKA